MILLSSKEVTTEESQGYFDTIVDFLLKELFNDDFELCVNRNDSYDFKISISGVPDNSKRIYMINYDIGIFRYIYDILHVILSNNSFFNNIGKTSGIIKVPNILVINWLTLDLAIANAEPVYFDAERKELHKYIYTLCLHFIVRHEIRHIANGHIDYLLNRNKTEFVEGFSNGLSAIDNQTIEMDVDSCVASGFIYGLLNDPAHLKFIPLKLQNIESIFESFLFALKVLFYCLPSKKISNISDAQKLSHPNCSLRYYYSFTACLSYLQETKPELFETFGKTYQRTFDFFHILEHQGILETDDIWKDYNWSMSDEGQKHANRIWKNWNHWIPKLEPYALLKLAPPEIN
jgi:hypothetical protein